MFTTGISQYFVEMVLDFDVSLPKISFQCFGSDKSRDFEGQSLNFNMEMINLDGESVPTSASKAIENVVHINVEPGTKKVLVQFLK